MATAEGWHGWDEYAEFYDWENARTVGRRDVAFWQAFARGAKGPVLELGCGTGRVLVPVARTGVKAIGVDRSAAMLTRAVRRTQRLAAAKRPRTVRGDIRHLPFCPATFGQVIAHLSQEQPLLPGDLLGSGTVGRGCGLEIDRWIEPGDVVELEVQGIGVLRNTVGERPTAVPAESIIQRSTHA